MLYLDNQYCDKKQSHVFRKRRCWPNGFLQLECKLSIILQSSIFGLRLNAFICEVMACDCSQYGLLFVLSLVTQKDSPQMQNSSLYFEAF